MAVSKLEDCLTLRGILGSWNTAEHNLGYILFSCISVTVLIHIG